MATQHDLYADSAQAQALDRRLSGEQEVHWAEGITPQQAAAKNRAWLAMIRKQDKNQKASSRTAIASALDKMEAMSGTGAARRTA